MSRALFLIVIALASACSAQRNSITVTVAGRPGSVDEDDRLAHLMLAARYPWRDDGRCAVQQSSGDWATLVERCYDALDRSRLRFVDREGVCPIAQAGLVTADAAARLVGICLLVQPELVAGAVIVIGVVVVAAAIAAEIEAAERAKKPGCRCECLKAGESPYTEFGRVASPAVCAERCWALKCGYTGSVCK